MENNLPKPGEWAERIRAAFGDQWQELEDPALEKLGITRALVSPFTVADLMQIKHRAGGDPNEALMYTFILKVCDDQGQPFFNVKDKAAIKSYLHSDDLARVVQKINAFTEFDYTLGKS